MKRGVLLRLGNGGRACVDTVDLGRVRWWHKCDSHCDGEPEAEPNGRRFAGYTRGTDGGAFALAPKVVCTRESIGVALASGLVAFLVLVADLCPTERGNLYASSVERLFVRWALTKQRAALTLNKDGLWSPPPMAKEVHMPPRYSHRCYACRTPYVPHDWRCTRPASVTCG